MKILAIDYITVFGHRNFNKIHVEALSHAGHSLHVIGRKEALASVKCTDNVTVTVLPEWGHRSFPLKSFSERIKNIAILYWIGKNINIDSYDIVVFLAYDVISLYMFKTSKPVFIINHNNIAQLDNCLKLFLTRHLPANYMHIALSIDAEKRLKQIVSEKIIYYVPHGYVKEKGKATRPSFFEDEDIFLFCPVNGNYDKDFVRKMFDFEKLRRLLTERNIKVIAKSKPFQSIENERLVKLEGRITEEEYRYLLCNALAVVLPYSDEFKYRCSGILYECIAADTPVIARNIEAMKAYMNTIQIELFKTVEDFVECINMILMQGKKSTDTTKYEPDSYWRALLEVYRQR